MSNEAAKKASARSLVAEADLANRTRALRLTARLNGIFAAELDDAANVEAANQLKSGFRAEAAVIFYESADGRYHCCIAGTEFPIALSEKHWNESVSAHATEQGVQRFGPWAPPVLDSPLPLWISLKLYAATKGAYIFLGRSTAPWTAEDEADIIGVAGALAPLISIRYARAKEELERRLAERRLAKNERRLRTFIEGSKDMIYSVNADDRIMSINKAGLELLGLESSKEALGLPFSSFVADPSDRDLLVERVRDRGYAADYEISLMRKDGSAVYCLESSFAIRSSDGGIAELQGIVKDISERIANERELWKMNLELAEANEELTRAHTAMLQQEKLASIGQLAAGVAHEINNPLGFLKSNHESLKRFSTRMKPILLEQLESLEPQRQADIKHALEEINEIFAESDEGYDRIIRIVDTLKNFARSDTASQYAPYDINAAIESALVVARNEVKYVADVYLELAELPRIEAAGNELSQVLLNVIGNAAQAIRSQERKEQGKITISTELTSGLVKIRISDDGPGIPDQAKKKVFDPFFTTKDPGKGTGLGLSISYDIVVNKHGGRLSVDSTMGVGTTFTIELPVYHDSQERQAPTHPKLSPRQGTA